MVPVLKPWIDNMGFPVHVVTGPCTEGIEQNTTWALVPSMNQPRALKPILITLPINLITASLDNQQWVIIRGINLFSESPGDIQHLGPRGSGRIPWDGSGWNWGPSVPLRRESTTTATHLFSLTPEIVIWQMQCIWETSYTDFFSLVSSTWPSRSKLLYVFFKGTWKGDGGWSGRDSLASLSRAFFPLPSHLLDRLLFPDGKMAGGVFCLLLSFSQGWKGVTPTVWFSFTLSNTPLPFYLFLKLCHLTEQIVYLHTDVFWTIFWYECQAQIFPAGVILGSFCLC